MSCCPDELPIDSHAKRLVEATEAIREVCQRHARPFEQVCDSCFDAMLEHAELGDLDTVDIIVREGIEPLDCGCCWLCSEEHYYLARSSTMETPEEWEPSGNCVRCAARTPEDF